MSELEEQAKKLMEKRVREVDVYKRQFEDTSILDFISYACAYFFRQQFFEWRMTR